MAALAEPLPEAAAVEEAVAAEAAAAAAATRRLGGPLAAPAVDEDGRVQLRVLIDGSAVEVFTGSGEVRPACIRRVQCNGRLAVGPLPRGRLNHRRLPPPPDNARPCHCLPLPPQPQVLSTRVYRGGAPAADAAGAPDAGCGGGCGVSVVALGGTAVLESGAAWEMEGCWAEGDGTGI